MKILQVAAGLLLCAGPVNAATITSIFTDESAFNAVLTSSTTEGFNGAAQTFGAGQTAAAIGSGLTMDTTGQFDSDDSRIIGNGFLELELDNDSAPNAGGNASDPNVVISFNTAGINAFGLWIQNDSDTTSGEVDLDNIGFIIDTEMLLLTDALGTTDSSTALAEIDTPKSTGPVFIGFVLDMAISEFGLIHGDNIAPFGVAGSFEDFYVDSLTFGSTATTTTPPPPPPVPLPATAVLLLTGIASLGVWARRRM